MSFTPTDRCRECGAGIARTAPRSSLWRDICGAVSCLISGHAHEPWPDILYQEAPSPIDGVTRMVARRVSLN